MTWKVYFTMFVIMCEMIRAEHVPDTPQGNVNQSIQECHTVRPCRCEINPEIGKVLNCSALDGEELQYDELTQITVPGVIGLSLVGNRLPRLPEGMFDNFTDLKYLLLGGNSLSTVPRAVQDITGLKQLHITKNALWINKGQQLFQPFSNLTVLNLPYNSITMLFRGMFRGLGRLLMLSVKGNYIRHIQGGVFRDTPSLKILDMQSNLLYTFGDRSMFTGLTNLVALNMRSIVYPGRYVSLSPDIFRDLHSLRNLDISNNYLREIPTGAFNGVESLLILRLQNSVMHIDKGLFSNLTSLHLLDISLNPLKVFDDLFEGLDELSVLVMHSVNAYELPADLFQPVPNLTHLDLRNNQLRVAPDISMLPQLEQLLLDHNRIFHLYPCDFMNQEALEELSVGSGLVCDCNIRWLKGRQSMGHLKLVADNKCAGPGYLAGKSLSDLSDDDLTCPGGMRSTWCKDASANLKLSWSALDAGDIMILWTVIGDIGLSDDVTVHLDYHVIDGNETIRLLLPHDATNITLSSLPEHIRCSICVTYLTENSTIELMHECIQFARLGSASDKSTSYNHSKDTGSVHISVIVTPIVVAVVLVIVIGIVIYVLKRFRIRGKAMRTAEVDGFGSIENERSRTGHDVTYNARTNTVSHDVTYNAHTNTVSLDSCA